MSINRVSFGEFLNQKTHQAVHDYGAKVKASPKTVWEINSNYGNGRILTMPLMSGAGLVLMDCTVKEDIEVYTEEAVQKSLSFTVCLQGHLLSCCSHQADVRLSQHQSLFVRSENHIQEMSSRFSGGEQQQFITIHLSEDWLKSDTDAVLPEILTDPYWQGVYNSGTVTPAMLTNAGEIINALKDDKVEPHYISAKVLELWSHQLVLLKRLAGSGGSGSNLHAKDVAPIHRAAEILLSEMVNPPSLLELSRRIGINDNKLKSGFKQVYGNTVFGYLHQHRLKTAKSLISARQCNSVSQAAHAVGFNSTSHFSSVFKQTYGLSPSQLLRNAVK